MSYVDDVIGIIGLVGLGYGAWLAWPPAGFMVIGAIMLAYAVASARHSARNGNNDNPPDQREKPRPRD